MGVEPTDGGVTRRPLVLKTRAVTGLHALPSIWFRRQYPIVEIVLQGERRISNYVVCCAG
jgi:hypothetical protein